MIKRKRYIFTGIVQGVGFRPFIHRVAKEHSLSGFVQNRSDGVVVEVEGRAEALDDFIREVISRPPPLADISRFSQMEVDVLQDDEFRIITSRKGDRGEVHIAPDIAVCDECLHELFSPPDRRYLYPFINCTNCGPRLTIIRGVPYDRENTSMACFPLCPECEREYENPHDRRFHAEPTACPVCGPSLSFLDSEGNVISTKNPVREAKDVLLRGDVIAVKGLGGYHLAVDATDDNAVIRLRDRKYREAKPLAIMVKDVEHASMIAHVGQREKDLLLSRERPIVLAKKKENTKIAPHVAPGMAHFGIMLPYTPLHHMLMDERFFALVMTSANHKDEPICIANREAISRLRGIADFFLVHNRDILVRCDDSIAMIAAGKSRVLRRSRGLSPKPVVLSESYPEILALGPQIKSTVCIMKGDCAFLSPHIGDMETPQARDFFHESVSVLQTISECAPKVIACDLHPGYYSSRVSRSMSNHIIIPVQHHHAHVVSCMAENALSGKVIGLAMDGTGYGTDGQVWGGEFLVADERECERAGHIRYYLLPGGEVAIREPWRIAVSLLQEAYGGAWKEVAERLDLIPEKRHYEIFDRVMKLKINSPYASSLGRIFDAVAAIIGLRRHVSFEGQAAMELEAIAVKDTDVDLPFDLFEKEGLLLLDLIPSIRELTEAFLRRVPAEEVAYAFHQTLRRAFTGAVKTLREKTGLHRVVLSGGCFQNRILLEGCVMDLEDAGFEVYSHSLVPTNDGGISLGQAVCAGARVKRGT